MWAETENHSAAFLNLERARKAGAAYLRTSSAPYRVLLSSSGSLSDDGMIIANLERIIKNKCTNYAEGFCLRKNLFVSWVENKGSRSACFWGISSSVCRELCVGWGGCLIAERKRHTGATAALTIFGTNDSCIIREAKALSPTLLEVISFESLS